MTAPEEYTDLVIPVPTAEGVKLEVPDGAVVVGFFRTKSDDHWVIWLDQDDNLMFTSNDMDWEPGFLPQEGIRGLIVATEGEAVFAEAMRLEYPINANAKEEE